MEDDHLYAYDTIHDEDAAAAQHQDDAFQKRYEQERTWEALQEDEHGLLRVDRTAEQRAKRQRILQQAAQHGNIRKGMMRYLLLVLDLSAAAAASDLRPSRLSCMLRAAQDFVRAFFDQNPLSQLGILVMHGGIAKRLTELSASPEAQLRRLEQAALGAEGAVSLQNALDMGHALLRNIPPYGHREMLVMLAALSTCDPGNIMDSIKAAKQAKIRVSVVGIAAELYVCRRMADDTGGTYGVALHEAHLSELMAGHAPPPPMKPGEAAAELVRMGFPQRSAEGTAAAVFVGPEARLLPGSYKCPRCKARVGELPCECHVCGLTLISSPHLARSYHHLFPVPAYEEVQEQEVQQYIAVVADQGSANEGAFQELPGTLCCFGCMRELGGAPARGAAIKPGLSSGTGIVLRCTSCRHIFCLECDAYVHESLHNCPGCECSPSLAKAADRQ